MTDILDEVLSDHNEEKRLIFFQKAFTYNNNHFYNSYYYNGCY
ncbi:DUF2659 family protein [Rickettsia sibirica]